MVEDIEPLEIPTFVELGGRDQGICGSILDSMLDCDASMDRDDGLVWVGLVRECAYEIKNPLRMNTSRITIKMWVRSYTT